MSAIEINTPLVKEIKTMNYQELEKYNNLEIWKF